jgi:DNA polymerase III epsilon subunit-like protein
MVKLIVLDTETTGLPREKKIGALESNRNWPDLVSICWHIYEDKELQRAEYHIIRPEGWRIGASSANIHGIDHATALRDGETLLDVLTLFKNDIANAYVIAAHNLHFDKNVLFHAYKWRLGIDPRVFWPTEADFCSAEEAKDEMKLVFPEPRTPGVYRFPRLDELYQDTFRRPAPANAHNAERDVQVLAAILFERWRIV